MLGKTQQLSYKRLRSEGFMSESTYYEKVFELQDKLGSLIKSLNEAQKIISPSRQDPETFPGLIDSTPKAKQLELLRNAWIVLEPLDQELGFGSNMDELMALHEDQWNCPFKSEPVFQGFAVGE